MSSAKSRRMKREEFTEQRQQIAKLPIPHLIKQLVSADLRTRFLAEMCLRDATST